MAPRFPSHASPPGPTVLEGIAPQVRGAANSAAHACERGLDARPSPRWPRETSRSAVPQSPPPVPPRRGLCSLLTPPYKKSPFLPDLESRRPRCCGRSPSPTAIIEQSPRVPKAGFAPQLALPARSPRFSSPAWESPRSPARPLPSLPSLPRGQRPLSGSLAPSHRVSVTGPQTRPFPSQSRGAALRDAVNHLRPLPGERVPRSRGRQTRCPRATTPRATTPRQRPGETSPAGPRPAPPC